MRRNTWTPAMWNKKQKILSTLWRHWIIISFLSEEWGGGGYPSYKTGIDFMIFILLFVDNCLLYYAKHDFSICLRTGSNPADINRFRSHTGNKIKRFLKLLFFWQNKLSNVWKKWQLWDERKTLYQNVHFPTNSAHFYYSHEQRDIFTKKSFFLY